MPRRMISARSMINEGLLGMQQETIYKGIGRRSANLRVPTFLRNQRRTVRQPVVTAVDTWATGQAKVPAFARKRAFEWNRSRVNVGKVPAVSAKDMQILQQQVLGEGVRTQRAAARVQAQIPSYMKPGGLPGFQKYVKAESVIMRGSKMAPQIQSGKSAARIFRGLGKVGMVGVAGAVALGVGMSLFGNAVKRPNRNPYPVIGGGLGV